MKSATIVTLVLVVLVVLSVVQAVQLNNLKSKVVEGELALGTSVKSTSSSSETSGGSKPATLPASIQNLPQMVGGC
ncbi:hypothetical protein CMO90_02175 [Candidatus Woesearchaeota archaeon]|jgi:hypothetical protein|nr:hypothetical protein [Candidatus Woesearchaeota archaeon]|tara:strand:- start:188 stop:415 length:228 start_codon:yes stop_codon:yes gene_type:complete